MSLAEQYTVNAERENGMFLTQGVATLTDEDNGRVIEVTTTIGCGGVSLIASVYVGAGPAYRERIDLRPLLQEWGNAVSERAFREWNARPVLDNP